MDTNALVVAVAEAFARLQAAKAITPTPLSTSAIITVAFITALAPSIPAVLAMVSAWRTREKVDIVDKKVDTSVEQNVDLGEKIKVLNENVNGNMGKLLKTTEDIAHAKGVADQKAITDAVVSEVKKHIS